MATDDKKPDDLEDLWAEIDAGDLPVDFEPLPADEVSFDLDAPIGDGSESPAASPAPGGDSDAAAADSDIDAWLNDPGESPRPSLSVFQEDESGAGAEEGDHALIDRSEIEIGTGHSGLPSPSSLETGSDPFAAEWSDAEPEPAADFGLFADEGSGPAAPEFVAEFGETESDEPGDSPDSSFAFEEVVESPVTHAAASDAQHTAVPVIAETPIDAARPAKKFGLGSLIGILAGGLLAIPLTLGILLWGFGRDPLGMAGLLPDTLSFLVPAALRPAGVAMPVAVTFPEPVVTELTSADEVGSDGAMTDGEPDVDLGDSDSLISEGDAMPEPTIAAEPADMEPEVASSDAAPADDVMADSDPAPAEPADLAALTAPTSEPDSVDDVPLIEPDSAPLLALLEPREPALPADPQETMAEPQETVVVKPEPEPLDISAVAVAAAAAVAHTEAVAASDASAGLSARELVDWYRALADYAEALARLEQQAVESGGSLAAAADSMTEVTQEIGSRSELHAHLARLTRDWIGYARRPSDGVVLPARFLGTRPVGPLWRSEIMIGDNEGRPDLALVVVTRAEPDVMADDIVVITGLVLADGVIWAADMRSGVGTEPGP
jgi:hypothetical protein